MLPITRLLAADTSSVELVHKVTEYLLKKARNGERLCCANEDSNPELGRPAIGNSNSQTTAGPKTMSG